MGTRHMTDSPNEEIMREAATAILSDHENAAKVERDGKHAVLASLPNPRNQAVIIPRADYEALVAALKEAVAILDRGVFESPSGWWLQRVDRAQTAAKVTLLKVAAL